MEQNNLSRVAEIQLICKPHYNAHNRLEITNASLAYKLFLSHWSMDKIEYLQEFKLMLLSRSNRVLGIVDISTGGVSKTVFDPKIIFSIVLMSKTVVNPKNYRSKTPIKKERGTPSRRSSILTKYKPV